jgi:DNA-binding NtrC family response regulator
MNAASHDDFPPSERPLRSRHTLLVVEDEVLLRFAACALLRDAGYDVLEAASAEEATSILQTVAVDLLFVDVHLRGREGDGLAVKQFARQQQPTIEVIMTSGKMPPGEAPEIAGSYRFLLKPYLFVRLLDTVKAALADRDNANSKTRRPS